MTEHIVRPITKMRQFSMRASEPHRKVISSPYLRRSKLSHFLQFGILPIVGSVAVLALSVRGTT